MVAELARPVGGSMSFSFQRLLSVALALILLALSASPSIASAPRAPSGGQAQAAFIPAAQSARNETAELQTEPIEATSSPELVMRSRPFVLSWGSTPAFLVSEDRPEPITAEEALIELEYFLSLRELSDPQIEAAMAQFRDPRVMAMIPAPTLRAALLMMTDWEPYDVVVESILNGNNPSGKPFLAVDFQDLEFEDAIATLVEDPRTDQYKMLIDSSYEAEPPQQLLPVIVHEALHGGGWNSAEEEIIANVLDTICYAEVLLIDPSAAFARTDLAVFNNVQVYSLLNSSGRRGAGHLGIVTSPAGDVYVGPGLEDFNAGSIREAIAIDGFYSSLGAGGSPGQATTTALISRFPGASSLGDEPPYSEEMLAVIDRGVSRILPPERVVELATLFELSRTVSITEPAGLDPVFSPLILEDRPFAPLDPAQYDLNQSRRGAFFLSESEGPAFLESSLQSAGMGPDEIDNVLEAFASTELIDQIPDPTLRVAALLLSAFEPWDIALAAILDGVNSRTKPLAVLFADLPTDAPAIWHNSDAQPAVLINALLSGERPEILAAAIVEGVMRDGDAPSENQIITAAVMGTIAYGQMLLVNPKVASTQTWWTVERNRDLIALLNSGAWMGSPGMANADTVGFLAAAGLTEDVLPGIIADAASFARYASQSARGHDATAARGAIAPPVMLEALDAVGVPVTHGSRGLALNDATMNAIDAGLYLFLSDEDVLDLALTLGLGIQGP